MERLKEGGCEEEIDTGLRKNYVGFKMCEMIRRMLIMY